MEIYITTQRLVHAHYLWNNQKLTVPQVQQMDVQMISSVLVIWNVVWTRLNLRAAVKVQGKVSWLSHMNDRDRGQLKI